MVLLIPLRQDTIYRNTNVTCDVSSRLQSGRGTGLSLKRTSYLCVDLLLPIKPSNSITMKHLLLLPLLLWAVSYADEPSNEQKSSTTKQAALKNTSNISISTEGLDKNTTISKKMGFDMDGAMINRALYVLIGITAIGVLYFLVRAVRLKKKGVQRKKYGLLSSHDDTMEMAHLESDEDDNTVYEAKSLRR